MLIKKSCTTENDLLQLAAVFAKAIEGGAVIYLQGPLGAGKTTFARGFLQALGYTGKVKSPTFSLAEEYKLNHRKICHFDFYRLSDPEELIHIGIHDYFQPENICLIEWPERGAALLPEADVICEIAINDAGRDVSFTANTDTGNEIIEELKKYLKT